MKNLRFEITPVDFNCLDGIRIQQGEIHAGNDLMHTILRSCVCIGFYSAARQVGAISHITGFDQPNAHQPEAALAQMSAGLAKRNLTFNDCECFVIGGSEKAPKPYRESITLLKAKGIPYTELDILGNFHRKLKLNPANGELILYKKANFSSDLQVMDNDSPAQQMERFLDPKRRLITGASLFFRNKNLLEIIRNRFLPQISASGKRIHLWCAGCSNGMEVYSIAMVCLNWLEMNKVSRDFQILGSDISNHALAMAQQGLYPVNIKNYQEQTHLLNRYTLQLDPQHVQMGPALKKTVHFVQRDIRQGSKRHLFELVVCDHVLQYFPYPLQAEMVAGLVAAVQPGGYLYASSPSHEIPNLITQKYNMQEISHSFYQLIR